MQDSCAVYIFKCACQLIDNILFVVLIENSVFYGLENVALHRLEEEVNILFVRGGKHLEEVDYVVVVYLFEDSDFAIDALCICFIFKGHEDLLDGVDLVVDSAFDLPYMTIGSAS